MFLYKQTKNVSTANIKTENVNSGISVGGVSTEESPALLNEEVLQQSSTSASGLTSGEMKITTKVLSI